MQWGLFRPLYLCKIDSTLTKSPLFLYILLSRLVLKGESRVWYLQEDYCMSARIRLKKFGTKKRPYYRIVVMDSRAPRDGKTIEELGYYHPIEAEEKQIVFNAEKVKGWIENGATVSDTVRSILNKKNFSLK